MSIKSRLFGETVDEVMNQIEIATEVKAPVQISDVLCTRDSYFHSCWLRMKLMHPDRIQEMGEIELFIAGMDSSDLEEEKEEDETEEGEDAQII
jgi:hypothetical protein